jgi:hypothetical protein
MTRRFIGALFAGTFAVGALTGAAGTIVVGAATSPAADLTSAMTQHLNGQGTGSMMSMMGGSMMGPGASAMPMSPGDHRSHHALPAPETTR